MINAVEIITAAMGDFGTSAIINGGQGSIDVVPDLDGSDVYDGESIEHTGPYALAKMADVTALGLVAGNNGDTLTINGTDYTLHAIDPDGMEGAVLKLEEQP